MSLLLDKDQQEIFDLRYALSGESWSDRALAVASHVAKAEENGKYDEYKNKFYEAINEGYLIPAGRILYGCGRKNGMLLNCFSLGIDDNRYSIADFMRNVYLVGLSGGGLGANYSKIRPKGALIQGVPGTARGTLSEIKKIDSLGDEIFCGGSRVIAMMASLKIDHPDILEFIDSKKIDGKLKNHNISVLITNEFIDCVKQDKEWKFKFGGREYFQHEFVRNDNQKFLVSAPNEETAWPIINNFYKKDFTSTFDYKGIKTFKARELWEKIVHEASTNGEPGIQFYNNIVDNFSTSYFEEFNSTNPCGEVPLSAESNCCLSSINLPSLFNEKRKEIDWQKLKDVIKTSVRFLDNVITINDYPIPETEVKANMSRRIGLGVIGLHYLLIIKDMKYGSTESLEYIEKLFDFIRNESYLASIEISKEKGSFQKYDYEKYIKNNFIKSLPIRIRREIEKFGIRNCSLISCAPGGTISMIAGVSSGIEPIYAPIRKERFIEHGVWKERIIVDKLFKKYFQEGKDLSNFIGATEISPEQHLLVQTTIQERVDSAVSKTINLPADYSDTDLSDLLLSHSSDLKGVTVYRSGSRGMEPLTAIPLESLSKEELEKIIEESNTDSDFVQCSSGKCDLPLNEK